MMNVLLILLSISFSVNSYPLNNLSSSQIVDQLCSPSIPDKRFAVPFPDMHRFLSTNHQLHRQPQHGNKKQDFHAYLCSISKDSEEMSNFLNIFIEEHGQAPAFNLFESCEQMTKRHDKTFEFIMKNLCSKRLTKRWTNSVVEGPIAIDYINQMLEARKVQSYPYSSEIDPYLVGR